MVSYDCRRWQIGCGHCPYLDVNLAIKRDGTHWWEWKLKNRIYHHSCLIIVALCSEMRTQANKGGDFLPTALKSECVLLIIGEGGEAITDQIDIPVYNLGYKRDDHQKAVSFSAADIFVSSTRAEIFGLFILKSMACGTPVVAFGVGGVIDLVRPGQTGHRVEVANADDLHDGMVQSLTDEDLRLSMGQQSQQVMVNKAYQVQEQISLYQKILVFKPQSKCFKSSGTRYEFGV